MLGQLKLPPHACEMGRLQRVASHAHLKNLKAAVAVFVAWYNFCRVHQTLRVTPAMEAGLTDHVWSIRELLTVPTELESAA